MALTTGPGSVSKQQPGELLSGLKAHSSKNGVRAILEKAHGRQKEA